MSRYIDADKLIKDHAEIIDCEIDHPKYEDTVREIIDRAPTADIAEMLKEYCIVGYTFDELLIFADACRRCGIEERNLVEFCTNVEGACDYVQKKIEEDLDKMIINGEEQEHE